MELFDDKNQPVATDPGEPQADPTAPATDPQAAAVDPQPEPEPQPDPRDVQLQAVNAELQAMRAERQQYLETLNRFAPQPAPDNGPDINAIIDKGLGESDAGRVLKEAFAALAFRHERELQNVRNEVQQRTVSLQMEAHEQRVVNELIEGGAITKNDIKPLREKVMQRAENARKRGVMIDLDSAYKAEAFELHRQNGFKAGDEEAKKRAALALQRKVATAPTSTNPSSGQRATMTQEQISELAREFNAKYPGRPGLAYEKYQEALRERGAL